MTDKKIYIYRKSRQVSIYPISMARINKSKKTTSSKRTKSKQNLSIDPNAENRGDSSLPITNHLEELRTRFLTVLVVLVLFTLIPFFFFGERLIEIFSIPYIKSHPGTSLNLFSLTEGLMIQLKCSLVTGIFTAIPLALYQIWTYVRPAIGTEHRTFVRNSLLGAVFLFYLGASVTYFLFIPFTIRALAEFTPSSFTLVINASNYLQFIFFFCVSMGIVFELPIAILVLGKLNIIKPETLSRKRKYAIVLIWIVAAIVTPSTDFLSQAIVAIPLMLLFEISILMARITLRSKK